MHYPYIIDASPPEGVYYCDVCNAICGENHIAVIRCYVTDWGMYCKDCAKKYRENGKISGLPVKFVFNKGEEIKITSKS